MPFQFSNTESNPAAPWNWSDATVLDEEITPTPEDPTILLRKRLVKAPDFDNPILVEDLVSIDKKEPEIVHIGSVVANQLLVSSATPLNRTIIDEHAKVIGWSVLEAKTTSAIVVLQTDNPELHSIELALNSLNEQLPDDSHLIIEPNHIYYTSSITPNDPKFSQGHQWALDANEADINAPEAWEIENSASDQIIAVIDTGILLDHEDLASNLWVNPNEIPGNGIDDDNNHYIDDIHGINTIDPDLSPNDDSGHGTHVAGIIGATGNNNRGIAGVAWDTNLLALKFLSAEGRGDAYNAIICIDYAIAAEASVINASWGGGPSSENLALKNAIKRSNEANILFVAAAGNEGRNTNHLSHFPSSYDLPNVLAIGSIERSGDISESSNRGSQSVDLFAPGGEILSTFNRSTNDYHTFSGTSMAAPFVSGAAALERAVFPNADLEERIGRILFSTRQDDRLASLCVSGGALDIGRLLSMVTVPLPPKLTAISAEEISIPEGEDLELEIEVDSDTPYSIQWYLDGINIHNTDTELLSIPSVSGQNAGNYLVKATNADGSSSLSFSVTVGTPDTLISQALDSPNRVFYNFAPDFWLQIDDLDSAGGSHLSYDSTKQKRSHQFATKIQGPATTRFWLRYDELNTLEKLPISFPEPETYQVSIGSVSNQNGWGLIETSFPEEGEHWLFWSARIRTPEHYKTLEIAEIDAFEVFPFEETPPVILQQPEEVEVHLGAQVKLETTAHGPNLTYQWYHNGEEIEAAQSRTIFIDAVLGKDAGQYHVVVSNQWGFEESEFATLSINNTQVGPFFTHDNQILTVDVDQRIVLQSEVGGSPPITYQWFKDGVPLPGIQGPSLEINSTQPEHAGEYTLEISNPYASQVESRRMHLIVNPTQLIPRFNFSTDPVHGLLPVYATIGIPTHPIYPGNFTVSEPAEYQWFKNGIPIPGATSEEFILESPALGDEGEYYLQVSNQYGRSVGPIRKVIIKSQLSDAFGDPEISVFQNQHYNLIVGATDPDFDGGSAVLIDPTINNHRISSTSVVLEIPVNPEQSLSFWLRALDPTTVRMSSTLFSNFDPLPISIVDTDEDWTKYAIPYRGQSNDRILLTLEFASTENKVWLDRGQWESFPSFSGSLPQEVVAIDGFLNLSSPLHEEPPSTTYQWFKNNEAIPGETASTLKIESSEAEEGDTFQIEANVDNESIRSTVSAYRIPKFTGDPNIPITITGSGQWGYDSMTQTLYLESESQDASSLEFNLNGPGVLKANGLNSAWETRIDGNLTAGTTDSGWSISRIYIPDGEHTVKLTTMMSQGSSTSLNLEFTQEFVSSTPSVINYIENDEPISIYYVSSFTHTLKWYRDDVLIKEVVNTNGETETSPFALGHRLSLEDAGEYRLSILNSDGYNYDAAPITYSLPAEPDTALDYPNSSVSETLETLVDSTIKFHGNESLLIRGPVFSLNVGEVTPGAQYGIWIRTSAPSVQVVGLSGLPETFKLGSDWTKVRFQPNEDGYADFFFEEEETTTWIDYLHIDDQLTSAINTRYMGTFLGDSVQFTASSSAGEGATFQWLKNGVELSGQTTGTLQIGSVSEQDFAAYQVRIERDGETATSEETILFSTHEFGQAIESPLARIRTWGESPWRIDPNVSTNGHLSIRSGSIGFSHLEIISPIGGLRAYYQLIERADQSIVNNWGTVTVVDLYNEDTIKVTNTTPKLVIWIDRLSEQPFPATNYQRWLALSNSADNRLQPIARQETLGIRDADSDSDGLSNFYEYVFGLDPQKSDKPFKVSIKENSGEPYMNFSLNLAQGSDFQFLIERSENLVDWTTVSLDPSPDQQQPGTFYRTLNFEHPIEGPDSPIYFYKYTIVPLGSPNAPVGITKTD